MSVVKINAITVPPGMGDKLEERFAGRAKMVEQFDGFEDFPRHANSSKYIVRLYSKQHLAGTAI